MITRKKLMSFAHYDPQTGIFTRTHSPCNSVKIGDEMGWAQEYAGGISYRQIEHQGKIYKAHRLAYLYMTGSFPNGQVDHIDGDGLNNKWSNLRVVTVSGNQRNRRLNHNNISGQAGVSYFRQTNKWRAAINVNGKKKHLGYFDTFDEAKEIRISAEKEFNYHPNHGNR